MSNPKPIPKNNDKYIPPYPPTTISPYQLTNSSPSQPAYVSPYAPINVSPSQPVNAVQGGHSAPGAEPTNTSQQDLGRTSTERPYKKAQKIMPRHGWDDQADALILAGHNAGKTIYEIISELEGHGYNASLPEVMEILRGEKRPKLVSNWDSRADVWALEAYHKGQTPLQIATQLCKNGYEAAVAKVVESLGRQGVTAQQHLPALTQPATPVWDSDADEIARNAHLQGQTVSQISIQLFRSGYAATNVLVVASLNRQGFNV